MKSCLDCVYVGEKQGEVACSAVLFYQYGGDIAMCNKFKEKEPMSEEYNLSLSELMTKIKEGDDAFSYAHGRVMLLEGNLVFEHDSSRCVIDKKFANDKFKIFPNEKKKVTMYHPDVFKNEQGVVRKNLGREFREKKDLDYWGMEDCEILRWEEIEVEV